MENSDRSLSSNDSPDLPNAEWELSELIQLVTAELDQAQDTLILKSQNRRLSMMVNQLNLDLQVDVRHDPTGRLLFRTSAPGQPGTTVLKLGFTPALDTQVQETRKSVDLEVDTLQPLHTLPDIQDSEIQRLKTVGIHSVNDLHGATQTPAMLTEVSLKAGLDESRLRLWRQWPFITGMKPENGIPGSIVVIDGGNLGFPGDLVEVYFKDRLAKVIDHTSTRLTVEMPRGVTGPGSVIARVNDQRTNTKTWRADVIDLYVKNIAVKSTVPLRAKEPIVFQADLINQGTLSIANFPVRWEVIKVGSQPPLEWSTQASLDFVTQIDELDVITPLPMESDDPPALPVEPVNQAMTETYLHGALQIQEQSIDSSTMFTVTLSEPGTYRVSFTVDPDNMLMDQVPTNNRFMREFVVEPAAPPVPKFSPSPGQFSPMSGRVGDRITISGSGFDYGTPIVRFGNVAATLLTTPTATQLVAKVPSLPIGPTQITVQTAAGNAISNDAFVVEPLPSPKLNSPPGEFTPKSGRAGDRITIMGSGFDTGSVVVRLGSAIATLLSTPTATQLVVRVPSISPGSYKISVQTTAGMVVSQESFNLLASSYYGTGTAIGSSLL